MSVVDSIRRRWAKDIPALEKAANAERTQVIANNRQIESLIAANNVAENKALEAEELAKMARTLLAGPEGVKADPPAQNG